MTPTELLKKIRRIEIRTSHMADDVFAGQYHSTFKGQGMEFEEVREYQPGDDIRSIDWNVTARHGRPFIKRFREERELTVMLLVDLSGSQDFGTAGQLKRELVTEVGATLAFSAIKNSDKIGLIAFSDRIERMMVPEKGPSHVLRVIRDLLTLKPKGRGTDIAGALDHLNHVLRRRSVVFIVSDFLAGSFEKQLRIAKRRHDIIPIVVQDQREMRLPKVGLVELLDNETGERIIVDTSSAAFRERYQIHALRQVEARDTLFRRMRIDSIKLETGQSYVEPIMKFFRMREARR